MRPTLTRLIGIAAASCAALSFGLPATAGATTPTGQSQGTLDGPSSDFSVDIDGWQPSWNGTVTWSDGALHVSATTKLDGAASPGFRVTPGLRYLATASVEADGTSTPVAAGLRFYDKYGKPLPASRQLGQVIATGDRWLPTPTVVGFAPTGAVTADAIVVRMADSTIATSYLVDDVTVSEVTGVAAPIVGPLHTDGMTVVDNNGHVVHLRGVQLGGMKNTTWTSSTVSTAEIDAVHRWGANFVRLPLAENPMVKGDCSYKSGYLSTVDRIVNDANSLGMLVLLDLHSNASTKCGDYGVRQPLPDSGALKFWTTVATRYKDKPLVAFDLYNEPYGLNDPSGNPDLGKWLGGARVTASDKPSVSYDGVGMAALYKAVRDTGATNMVFAGGNPYVAAGGVAALGGTNLVASVHSYVCSTTPDAGPCDPASQPLDPSAVLDQFKGLPVPVVVTDFGYPDPKVGDYQTKVAEYAAAQGWIGWSAFVVNNFATGTGQYQLNADAGTLWNPNPNGMAVILGMLGN